MDQDAMDSFANALQDPEFRRQFNKDPLEALRNRGIDTKGIPPEFMSAIAELSTTELRLIADILSRVRSQITDITITRAIF